MPLALYDRTLRDLSQSLIRPTSPPPGPTDVVVQRPEAEADEMWSFVGEKANKQWSWFTMNAKTHQIMAFHVADRSRASRAQLWANVPEVYRQQAVFHTDLYNAFLL
jgi:IS1 transposase